MHMVGHLLAHKSAQTIQQKGEFEGALYITFETTPKISLQRAHKNAKKCEEKDAFFTAVGDPLDSVIKDAPECALEVISKDALYDFHKDAQEGAFEVALKGAIEVTLSRTCGCTC